MLVSTNNTPKNNKKGNTTTNDEQRTIERLRFLLKNAIQVYPKLNDELEKKNALLLYRVEQQQNQSQQSISQDDYKQQLTKLQCQLSEAQLENQQLQQSLKNLKLLGIKSNVQIQGNQNPQNNKKNFELILQDCSISSIEKQFYEYFEKSSAVLQEQMILEFQNRLEKYQTKYQIVEIHRITSFTNLDKTKCIESQQREIDILESKLNNTEKELSDLKRVLESYQQQYSMKQSQQDQVHDFFNSNQFEVFTSRLNNSQGMDECLSTDKRWIDIDNNQLKTDERKLIQYEKIIENQKLDIESLQDKLSNLSKKKHQLKLQNQELSSVLYQQAETCQRIISNLQAKIEKQGLQIQYYSSIQQMRSKLNQQSSKHSVQSSQQIDIRKKFTYHSPNANNSPVSLAKSQANNRSLKKQDSSNDQTTWIIKTTDASLVKKLDKKDSQSESTTDQVQKPTKLSTHLQEVKKSLDQISNGNCTQKLLKGYYFAQNKPILTLDDF
ncbi:unnamed protein product (macronuclear) [Paramecium tetraurelia]|uniref:Uncharacterized protein n=1 Tax=Paramecium tetraurelia TaxID=5888 RepID=A0E8W5_PARTE|nr:uncharacterized protein GSPATT00024463001 [Paramecium tetraurelia]CAK91732.1 unnamed protein product [Paramecium tetraurelia]|eukprot:XP_001459129.1 hypothetical protein (macronuclear) [Paramecium tetraurelia strain d4-2]